jgi:hypothetical protein
LKAANWPCKQEIVPQKLHELGTVNEMLRYPAYRKTGRILLNRRRIGSTAQTLDDNQI